MSRRARTLIQMSKRGVEQLPDYQSYKSALVLIPPSSAWSVVETIRAKHDKRYKRWMPHITLIFPFVNPAHDVEVERVLKIVKEVTFKQPSFVLTFDAFGNFVHSRNSRTLYLKPNREAEQELKQLVDALAKQLPDLDDVRRDGIFTPHLSLGQFRSQKAIDEIVSDISDRVLGSPITYDATDIAWVTRANYHDRMKVKETFHFADSV